MGKFLRNLWERLAWGLPVDQAPEGVLERFLSLFVSLALGGISLSLPTAREVRVMPLGLALSNSLSLQLQTLSQCMLRFLDASE